jgi:AbrB family looped-hinge helix DNA binding protein
MTIVRLSAKFQITIPKPIRGRLGIRPGQSFMVTEQDGAILFTPVPDDPIKLLCGCCKGEPSLTEELLRERQRDLQIEEARAGQPPMPAIEK